MLPLTPTKLGRYEIVDEIGKGAMGVVYLARDPLIGRLVALKTFRIGFSVKDRELEEFRTRFMREAQSAGILSHANIVTIHDVVENSEEGLAFIAMEYVRGTNLKQVLQEGRPVTQQFVLDVIAQVGDALDYAHASKVIHRDVKPANILITSEGRVKITDFGIARLETSNLTLDGQMLGTPNYMAPEQIQGKKEVDYRADLFSLGVVLYEMLTRHKPFSGENLTVVSHRIVYEPFTPPREFVKELPPGVEPILDRALQKDPAKRYQRARELVEDLRRALVAAAPAAGQSVPADGTVHSELNDTMSLSATVVLPPELPEPKPAVRQARRAAPGLGRLLAWGAAAVVVGVLAWAGVLLARQWAQPAPPPVAEASPPIAPQDELQLARLVSQGKDSLVRKQYAHAAEYFRQAERLAPADRQAEVQTLRRQAEAAAATVAGTAARRQEIDHGLAAGEEALAKGNRDEAVRLADAVLALEADNPLALDLRKRAAPKSSSRSGKTAATPAPVAPTAPAEVAATTPAPAAEPEAGQAQESSLVVDFLSAFSGNVSVIVRLDTQQVFRKDVGRGGLFRRRSSQDSQFVERVTIPARVYKVSVHVAPSGKAAKVQPYDANFPGGGTRTVVVRVTESGQVSVTLI